MTVFVLIDALGWTYIESAGFLADCLPYRTPVKTVLGYSSGAIPTILTGKTPAQTGHWNLFYYSPARSRFQWLRHCEFLPDAVLNHRVTRKLLKEAGRRVLGLGPLFECALNPRHLRYFDWVEKRNIYAEGGVAGSIFESLAQEGLTCRSYSYHAGTDAELLAAACRDVEARRAGFYFVYLSEMDHFLHHHCTEPALVNEKLDWYGGRLRELFRLARGIGPAARLAVASDHGMTPVRGDLPLAAGIAKLGLSMPSDYLAVYDSTMARFWCFNSGARRLLLEHLETVAGGRVLADEELHDLGILFEDRRYGEIIFLAEPGLMLGGGDFETRWRPIGMHGYHPSDPYSDAIFLSDRPPRAPVRAIADFHAWMREPEG